MASVTGFGQAGPYNDYKDSTIVCEAIGAIAIMYMTGLPDKPPLQQGHFITCYALSMFVAPAILMARYCRNNVTELGQQIDISYQENMASIQDLVSWAFIYWGKILKRCGRFPYRIVSAPVEVPYRCKEGYIWSFILGPERWNTFISWIIQDGIDVGEFANPEYQTMDKRAAERCRLSPIIAE